MRDPCPFSLSDILTVAHMSLSARSQNSKNSHCAALRSNLTEKPLGLLPSLEGYGGLEPLGSLGTPEPSSVEGL